jgi:serine/threonine protein kinase
MGTQIEQIEPYKILGELGRGGMATVYKAIQPCINRVVALKALPSHLESEKTAERRVAKEAETAGNLRHQNIVKLHDASVHQPPYYIAMEFLEGGTPADRLAHGPFSLTGAVRIVQAVRASLDYAHERGIVHRDIKPANMMFDDTGRPVVTDFGIARASDHTRLTADGPTFGTPSHMSPEHARGQRLDHRLSEDQRRVPKDDLCKL